MPNVEPSGFSVDVEAKHRFKQDEMPLESVINFVRLFSFG
jgi:hypothetical protein